MTSTSVQQGLLRINITEHTTDRTAHLQLTGRTRSSGTISLYVWSWPT